MANRVFNTITNCGITNKEFLQIKDLVWKRNRKILKITSILAMAMGFLFFLYVVLISKGDTWLPYVILFSGSTLIFVAACINPKAKQTIPFDMLLCYAQMLLLCAYAIILSTLPSNHDIPATSVVVFVALLPLSVDDRPIRMYVVMLIESITYLIISYFFKSPSVFALDVMNMGTFVIIGMILYGFICTRNVREISQSEKVKSIQGKVIAALATVVEERDETTGSHIIRSGEYVSALIKRMKRIDRYSEYNGEFFRNVILAAPLHDIGKIKIPDYILNKPGKLTPEEFEIIKKHAEYGGNIVRRTVRDLNNEQYSTIAYNIARHHHERYDGTGYPDGLKGEAIPLEARIMALADVYDALISERPYKKALTKQESIIILRDGSGTQFDPILVELFIDSLNSINL